MTIKRARVRVEKLLRVPFLDTNEELFLLNVENGDSGSCCFCRLAMMIFCSKKC